MRLIRKSCFMLFNYFKCQPGLKFEYKYTGIQSGNPYFYEVRKIVWILLLVSGYSFGQQQKITTIGGLPTRELYDITTDRKGFLWIGHELGLSRYDGIHFTSFNHPKQTSLSISEIKEDSTGRIWCHNFSGQIFYIENSQMHLLEAYRYEQELQYPRIQLYKNELLATSRFGLFVYDLTAKKSRYITKIFASKDSISEIQSIQTLQNGVVVLSNAKWFFYNGGNGLQQLKTNALTSYLTNTSISIMLGNFKGDTIFTTSGINNFTHLLVIRGDSIQYTRTITTKGRLNGMATIANGQVWLHDKEESRNLAGNQLFSKLNLSAATEDRERNLWLTSITNGLMVVKAAAGWKLEMLTAAEKKENFTSLLNMPNVIVAGTNSGNIYIKNAANFSTQKIIQLPPEVGAVDKILRYNNHSVVVAGTGWVCILDINTYKLQKLKHINMKAWDTLQQTHFFATTFGVLALPIYQNTSIEQLEKSLSKFSKDRLGNNYYFIGNRCRSLQYVPTEKALWVLLKDGIYKLHNGITTPVLYKGNRIYASNLIRTGDKMYIGSFSNGLLVYNKGTFREINSSNGLKCRYVLRFKITGNYLWLFGDGPLQVIDLNTEQFVVINNLPPIAGSSINDICSYGQDFLLSTSSELYKISMANTSNTVTPVVSLLTAMVNEKDTLYHQTQLPYGTRNLNFLIGAPWFNNAEGVVIHYKIELFNNNAWVSLPAGQRNIRIESLPPGTYTLEAYAATADGKQSKPVSLITFTVNRPYWQKWWVLSLLVVFSALIVWAIIKMRVEHVNKQNKLLIEKLALQSQLRESLLTAIKSQMNPHFIFNALNTIQSYIYTNNKQKANIYLGKFSDLIRLILDNSQKKSITLTNETEMLQLYLDLEQMRFENTLTAVLEVDKSLPLDSIHLPPMLVQPYVENALKHGLLHKKENRKLWVKFSHAPHLDALEIIIEDNGIGREQSLLINKRKINNHQSFSTYANQKRLDLINQSRIAKIQVHITDLVNGQGVAAGTRVCLTIPFHGNL
jgi:hypothetical protein